MRPILLSLPLLIAWGSARAAGNEACLPAEARRPLWALAGDPSAQRMPMTLRLLGFSPSGRMAVLQESRGEESEAGLWTFRAFDLPGGEVAEEIWLESEVDSTKSFCREHGDELKSLLAKHGIKPSSPQALARFPLRRNGETLEVSIRRMKDPAEEGTILHEVRLRTRRGTRTISVIREADVDAGVDPTGPPVVLGAVRDPWSGRTVVILQQVSTQLEGIHVTVISVLGIDT